MLICFSILRLVPPTPNSCDNQNCKLSPYIIYVPWGIKKKITSGEKSHVMKKFWSEPLDNGGSVHEKEEQGILFKFLYFLLFLSLLRRDITGSVMNVSALECLLRNNASDGRGGIL